MNFQAGQEVVCIDDQGTNLVRKGETYKIEELHGNHFLRLAGVNGKGKNSRHGMSKYRFCSLDDMPASGSD